MDTRRQCAPVHAYTRARTVVLFDSYPIAVLRSHQLLACSTLSKTPGLYRAGKNTCRKGCHPGLELKHGKTCHAKCDEGFRPERGTRTYTCGDDKALTNTAFSCFGKVTYPVLLWLLKYDPVLASANHLFSPTCTLRVVK